MTNCEIILLCLSEARALFLIHKLNYSYKDFLVNISGGSFMNKEKDYLEDDVLFEDFGELDELDFGDKEKRAKGNVNQEEIQEKIEYVDENLWSKLEKSGKRISFAKDILALYHYMKDPFVKWYRKAIVVAALIYFIVPIDTIPDLTPLFGYLDDLGVITALLKYLGNELMSYYPPGYRT